MKKRFVVAMLMLSMAFGMTASGASNTVLAEEEAATESVLEETFDLTISRLVSVDDIEKYITLAAYKGMELENPYTTVTDEEVEIQITSLLESNPSEAESGAEIQEGDTALFDCTAVMDGEDFDTGLEPNTSLVIGSGSFIDGFEDGMIGMKVGETRDLALTFPETYYEDLAGKDVVFTVTVNSILRPQEEITDEWVSSYTDGEMTTVDEYRESLRADLQQQYDDYAEESLYQIAWQKVLDETEVKKYPEEDLAHAKELSHGEMESYAAMYGLELSELLEYQGMTEEDLEELETEYAQEMVKQNLIVQAIVDAEEIDLEDEETQAIRQELANMYGVSDLSELMSVYGKERVDDSIALRRVEIYLVSQAVIVEAEESEELDSPEETVIIGSDSADVDGTEVLIQSDEGAEEVLMEDGDGTTNEEVFEENGIAVIEDDGETE